MIQLGLTVFISSSEDGSLPGEEGLNSCVSVQETIKYSPSASRLNYYHLFPQEYLVLIGTPVAENNEHDK